MAGIHRNDIEAALQWWRGREAPAYGWTPQDAVAQLTALLALLDRHQEVECDEASMPAHFHGPWLAWYDSLPDTPCIAICSTSQGDALCKGCGRTFAEVQHWPEMSPAEKRATWRRITAEGTAWRFNRYAERAQERLAHPAHRASSDTSDTSDAGPSAPFSLPTSAT